MSQFHLERTRTASPGVKHVAFDHKCQVIPETDCAELRKLLILCPTRAQSPPIVSSSSGFIARAISPQLVRANSPGLRKASGLGNAPPHAPTSWRTRIASWGSVTGSTDVSTINSDATFPSASAKPAQATFTSSAADDGPRLVAPVAARGIPSPMMPFDDDESILVDTSPSHESVPDFDDVDAEFQHAISGAANISRRSSVTVLHAASPSLSAPQPPRSTSPFVHTFSSLGKQQIPSTSSGSRPKSCLVRYSSPQAPGPPSLAGDGMSPLRTTRSHDRDGCFAQRRRADGVPVVCPSPLSSPEDEQGGDAWDANTIASTSQPAKDSKLASRTTEKTKLSRWKRFRRAISEDSQSFEPEGAGRNTPPERRLDDVAVKREVQAGRWPFEAPLNTECSCKNCQDKIEVGLASNYEPKWTRAARIRWLEGQEDAAARSKEDGGISAAGTPRLTSRIAIQADEVAQLHNETVHPMTQAELAASDPTSPQTEREEALTATARSDKPTVAEEGDEALRREIMARRQKAARQSPVLRHGARSMMRQIEEAERREQEAARVRTQSREGHRRSASVPGTGSGRSSPASSASQGITPSTPDTASTSPQERHAGGDSYFDLPQSPPERVRSPLIPVEVACNSNSGSSNNNNTKPGYARSLAADDATWSIASVAQTLEALASPTASPQTSPYVEK